MLGVGIMELYTKNDKGEGMTTGVSVLGGDNTMRFKSLRFEYP